MKILIMGRSGTGKDTLKNLLKTKGLTEVISATTRPRRYPDEDTHRFIDEETAEKEKAVAVAKTEINGYTYYATKEDVENADIYIIDPNALYELAANMPDTAFTIVYMQAELLDRKTNAVKRSENPMKEEMVFTQRSDAEDAQFSEFEDKLSQIVEAQKGDNLTNILPPNANSIVIFDNNFDERISEIAEEVYRHFIAQKSLCRILNELYEKRFLADDNGRPKVKDINDNIVSLDVYADLIVQDKAMLGETMRIHLIASDPDIKDISDLRIPAALT